MKHTLLILALAALASCSKEQVQPTPDPADGRIRVVAGVAATRAVSDALTGLTGASFVIKEGNATVPASFAGGTAYTGNVAATSGEVNFTSLAVPTYNPNDNHAWFVAYAPGGSLTADAIEWAIDGATDIMLTNSPWDAGKYSVPQTTGLNFNHRLSQVEVICQAENGTAASVVEATWGKITKIAFAGAPTRMKYDLSSTPTVITSGSADTPLLADYNGTPLIATAIPAYGNTTATAVAMLAPVAPTATESFILIVTTSGAAATPNTPIEVEIPIKLNNTPEAMTAGRKHQVTLTFKAQPEKIVPTATVTEWSQTGGGSADIGVPKSYPYVIDGRIVVTKDLKGEMANTPFHDKWTVTPPHNDTAPENAVSKRFEVASADDPSYFNSWSDAERVCATYSQAGVPAGSWRVPTLREWQTFMSESVRNKLNVNLPDARYIVWSATEDSNNSSNCWAYYIGSDSGHEVRSYGKDDQKQVRCIRDL